MHFSHHPKPWEVTKYDRPTMHYLEVDKASGDIEILRRIWYIYTEVFNTISNTHNNRFGYMDILIAKILSSNSFVLQDEQLRAFGAMMVPWIDRTHE